MSTPTENSYDVFSENYDRFVNWQNRIQYELPFLQSTLLGLTQDPAVPLKILDAACGTGMHAIALARSGFQVTGTDLSAGMIAKAQENAQTANVEVEFKTAGFAELYASLQNQKFDAVICLGNSLPHLLSTAELSDALNNFHSILRPGGLLLLQNRNFDAVVKAKERWMEPQAHTETNNDWVFIRFYDFRDDGLINFNIMTLSRTVSNPWQQRITTTVLRPLLANEFVASLNGAQFTSIHRFGGLDGSAYSEATSGNLVITALRA